MKKRFLVVKQNLVLGLLSLLMLFGVTSSARAAGARTKIIVVVPHRILFTVALPVYIAHEKGFYKENNVDVDAVFTRGGGENVQAVVSGDAQIGLGTGTLAVISAFVKKAPIKIAAAEITGMDAFGTCKTVHRCARWKILQVRKLPTAVPARRLTWRRLR
jgi:ABC-type nitrate/sulfonate/bicarbonate transport system substrate-binding protein